jgi:hypothetical protein
VSKLSTISVTFVGALLEKKKFLFEGVLALRPTGAVNNLSLSKTSLNKNVKKSIYLFQSTRRNP